MKIIFLDIDGVLNFYKSKKIDTRCLFYLKRIVKKTNAYIVLSSSWKESVLYPQCCSEFDNQVLDDLMNRSGLPFIGVTPDIDPRRREVEIQEWLKTAPEPVESFVIIDDLKFGFPVTFHDNFVQTSGFLKWGLTYRQASKAIKILNHKL